MSKPILTTTSTINPRELSPNHTPSLSKLTADRDELTSKCLDFRLKLATFQEQQERILSLPRDRFTFEKKKNEFQVVNDKAEQLYLRVQNGIDTLTAQIHALAGEATLKQEPAQLNESAKTQRALSPRESQLLTRLQAEKDELTSKCLDLRLKLQTLQGVQEETLNASSDRFERERQKIRFQDKFQIINNKAEQAFLKAQNRIDNLNIRIHNLIGDSTLSEIDEADYESFVAKFHAEGMERYLDRKGNEKIKKENEERQKIIVEEKKAELLQIAEEKRAEFLRQKEELNYQKFIAEAHDEAWDRIISAHKQSVPVIQSPHAEIVDSAPQPPQPQQQNSTRSNGGFVQSIISWFSGGQTNTSEGVLKAFLRTFFPMFI